MMKRKASIWSRVFLAICLLTVLILFAGISAAEEESTQPAELKDPRTNIDLIYVKGGCYQMGDIFGDGGGDAKQVHEVCVDDFYMGKYPVTQGQWKWLMGNNPSCDRNCGDKCPVESVSWKDVQDFIERLNQRTDKQYRLPTEAEWEYAARSGGKKEYWAGTNSESELDLFAWYEKNSKGKIHPVGKKKPNGLGLYDMSGNVWQWVQDWYDPEYYSNSPKNNPAGPESGLSHIIRGGSWSNPEKNIRTTYRNDFRPSLGADDIGFRLVRTK